MAGTNGSVFAIGDCTASTYAPTTQVASQQGTYLARLFAQLSKRDAVEERLSDLRKSLASASQEEKEKVQKEVDDAEKQFSKIKLRPFNYSHQGALAYIGSEKAIAALPF